MDYRFFKAINETCDQSDGSLAIHMANAAKTFENERAGRSSIIDSFPQRISTNEYDIQELQISNYSQLFLVHQSERLLIYRAFPPRKRRNKRSPDFPRDIDVEVFEYKRKWVPIHIKMRYPYHSNETPLRANSLIDLSIDIDTPDFNYDDKRLVHHFDWERRYDAILQFTNRRLIDGLPISIQQLMGILKVMGEYHDLKGCARASLVFYNALYRIASREKNYTASVISLFLIMQAASRINSKQYQEYALRIAEKLYEECTKVENIRKLGRISLSIICDVALVLSHFNNAYNDMYKYGLYKSAAVSLDYNKIRKSKIDKVVRLLSILDSPRLETFNDMADPRYLHFLDVCGLAGIVNGLPQRSFDVIQSIKARQPQSIGNYGQYLSTKHNEILLLQVHGTDRDRIEAQSLYFELMEEQRLYSKSISSITASNLASLIDEPEFDVYLQGVVGYGIPPHIHKKDSRTKAREIYRVDYVQSDCFRNIIFPTLQDNIVLSDGSIQ